MIASFRQVQKPPSVRRLPRSEWNCKRPLVLLLEECSKVISPTLVEHMNSLQLHELLARRGCIAPKLGEEIHNSPLLGDLSFRDVHLSNSLNEIVHDGLALHRLRQLPLIRVRCWLSHTAELREAMNFSVRYSEDNRW
jgi:hypothetical protein